MTAPTVGRLVYYTSYGTPGGEFPSTDRAALVTAVHNVTLVDLCVFSAEGLFFTHRVVQGAAPGQWDWMPFQKDQAARLAAGTRNDSHPEPTEGTP